MTVSKDVLLGRVHDLLKKAQPEDGSKVNWMVVAPEIISGTQSLMEIIHGPSSPRISAFLEQVRAVRDASERHLRFRLHDAADVAEGVLQSLEAEISAGLVGNIAQQAAGDVVGDFIRLARAALDAAGEGSKNVGAVLAAAAYEDTIRRMGREFGGVMGRDDLEDVIGSLKKAGVLVAPQLGIAIGYLSFRNHALHAEWDEIDLTSVHSVLAFVEQLLLKHFSL